ncbi:MAG: hypothetical protein IT162_15630 [Bryobacterales bacterium]|nr:hypothetical protein [Bryobacterales bacterium]
MMPTKLFASALVLAIAAFAADVSGKWTAQVPGRNGQSRDVTITLKADGGKLTGTMDDGRASNAITDGSVDGGAVTFSVETQRGKRTYKGTMSGDNEIKFKREGGQNAQEFTAKRAAS